MKANFVQPNSNNLTATHNLGVPFQRMSRKTKDQIILLHREGYTPKEIGRILGIPDKSVNSCMYKQRIQRKIEISQYSPDPKFDRAQEMWANGMTVREIAVEYGYSRRTMGGVIERYRAAFGLFPSRYQRRT